MTPTTYHPGAAPFAIRFAVSDSSLGPVLVAASERGVCAILMGDDPEVLARDLEDPFPEAMLIGGDAAFDRLVARVVELVEAPGAGLDLPLDLQAGTSFQQSVWKALLAIPHGATTHYGALSRDIGAPAAARAVGAAVGRNHVSIVVPCHRVVGAAGALVGYAGGLDRKRRLLDLEEPESASSGRLF